MVVRASRYSHCYRDHRHGLLLINGGARYYPLLNPHEEWRVRHDTRPLLLTVSFTLLSWYGIWCSDVTFSHVMTSFRFSWHLLPPRAVQWVVDQQNEQRNYGRIEKNSLSVCAGMISATTPYHTLYFYRFSPERIDPIFFLPPKQAVRKKHTRVHVVLKCVLVVAFLNEGFKTMEVCLEPRGAA